MAVILKIKHKFDNEPLKKVIIGRFNHIQNLSQNLVCTRMRTQFTYAKL